MKDKYFYMCDYCEKKGEPCLTMVRNSDSKPTQCMLLERLNRKCQWEEIAFEVFIREASK